ncbi:MAG: hypothetical protein JKX94_06175 [Sneathiella sp.]|nr:hypothetical protein [Sneathiella sp.]
MDEPFYAYYLSETGLSHPMRNEVIASQSQNWQHVMTTINAPLQGRNSLLYVKHMTQHMLPEIDLSQLLDHKHCFLIREPRLVIASFSEKFENITADATGFRQQLDLFNYFIEQGLSVSVVEGEDIQKSPETLLTKLCESCDISFDRKMLSWPPGKRPEDGVWGAHWYNAVETSTGFAPYVEKEVQLTRNQEKLAKELEPYYLEMKTHKITLS